MDNSARFLRRDGLLILFAALQLAFWGGIPALHRTEVTSLELTNNPAFVDKSNYYWIGTRHVYPDIGIVPDVPSTTTVKALSFGDEEFYFRLLGQDIQNAGDTFGRFTELYKYDYAKLYQWFSLLDKLDNESDYIPFLASYYYSQTQNVQDVRYVVDYLYDHSRERPARKYWWLAQAAYLADHKLKDKDLALKVAAPLEQAHDAPFWVRELPAFVHESRGEMEDARHIIENIEKNTQSIPPSELRFMTYFVKERLKKLQEQEP